MQQRETTREEYQKRVNIIVEYINNHLNEDIDLGKLADMSHFSPCHFHRILKAFLGEPVGAFITRMRVETAARLLRYTDLPVQEIAWKVGYEMPSSLSKVFRQFYNISPHAYRTHKNYFIMKPLTLIPELKLKNPKIVESADRQVIYVRLTGAYVENDYAKAWECLWKCVKEQKLFSAGIEHICIYHDDPKVTSPEKLRTDVCLTISKPVIPQGEIGVKNLEGGTYAVFLYQGPYGNLGAVYDYIYARWLPESGYGLGLTPAYEKYLNHPGRTEPAKLKTEIYIPVISR